MEFYYEAISRLGFIPFRTFSHKLYARCSLVDESDKQWGVSLEEAQWNRNTFKRCSGSVHIADFSSNVI